MPAFFVPVDQARGKVKREENRTRRKKEEEKGKTTDRVGFKPLRRQVARVLWAWGGLDETPLGLAPSLLLYVVVVVDNVGSVCSCRCCMSDECFVCTISFFLPASQSVESIADDENRVKGKKKTKREKNPRHPNRSDVDDAPPSNQILATRALPSGTRAWQTISFRLVPHSSHSPSSARSRQMLPRGDGAALPS